ncbi:MAG: type II secretion system GspH family protein [bacterium]|nr:type II secretion system GspH family protein [bacterium]
MSKVIYSKSGLTLMEILIALAIFAVAGVISLQSCLISTRHIQIVNNEKNLVMLSNMKLEEYKIEKIDIEREKNGFFAEPFEDYYWEFELADITITDTEYGVSFTPYKLTVGTKGDVYSTLTSFLKSDRLDEKK